MKRYVTLARRKVWETVTLLCSIEKRPSNLEVDHLVFVAEDTSATAANENSDEDTNTNEDVSNDEVPESGKINSFVALEALDGEGPGLANNPPNKDPEED